MTNVVFPIDFNRLRVSFVNEIKRCLQLDDNHVIYEEPETQNSPRPTRPYMSFKFIGPATKIGDDSQDHVSGVTWNSGGCRKLMVSFHFYGKSRDEAYNYMSLWQASLNLEPVLERLRGQGIAVWMVGNVADLSILLNTGYEGRSHIEVTFGIESNMVSDYGQMEHATVEGTINDSIHVSVTV